MVDLRVEMDYMLENYGSDFLLIRNDKRYPCTCITQISASSNDRCPLCLGTGYWHSAEKIRGRTKATSSADTLPKSVNYTQIGDVGVSLRHFYTNYLVRPKGKDLIVVCEWNGKIPVFDEYTEIYEVNYAEPMRGDNGRIEYFKAVAKSDPVNMKLKFNNIKNNAGKLTYIIATR